MNNPERQITLHDDSPHTFTTPCDICGKPVLFVIRSEVPLQQTLDEHSERNGGVHHDRCVLTNAEIYFLHGE